MSRATASGAFSGIRVLDLSTRLAGAWAGRLFAGYGAQVLLVEPPTGHPLQLEPPFHDGQSLVHAYANDGKEVVVDADGSTARLLAEGVDLLITTTTNLDPLQEILRALPEQAVHLSVTPHGLTGPLAHLPGTQLTHCARTGWANVNSFQQEPPLQLPLRQVDFTAGIAAFNAAAAACFRALSGGPGTQADVSELEAAASLSAPWAILGLFFDSPRTQWGPGGPTYRTRSGPLWTSRDGLINFGFAEWARWQEAMAIFGLNEIGEDDALQPVRGRQGKNLKPVVEALADATRKLGKWELFHKLAGELHCIAGAVQSTSELLDNEHLEARDFLTEIAVGGSKGRAPAAPARLTGSPWRPAAPSASTSASTSPAGQQKRSAPGKDRSLPLKGVRVLSFTQAWSGTFGTEILSLLGADVVQIEGRQRPDVWRGNGAPVPKGLLNPALAQSPLNTNGMYNSVNLNKRAITLDMRSAEGRDLFWQLVPRFDVLCENFSPKVMGNWGITLETLQAQRPDIIFASLSGYGQTGPLARYPANGNTIEPMSGLSSLNGYPGDPGKNTSGLVPDPISGYYFAGAILAALAHRQRTGEGQRIDLSMMEAVAVQLGVNVLETSLTADAAGPAGNRHPRLAPHGYFLSGDGLWVAVAVEDEQQWRRLAELLKIEDARFATMAGRKAEEAALDQIINAWCQFRSAAEIESNLRGAGVCVATVANFLEVYRKPAECFTGRDYLVPVTHPESGTHAMPTLPWRYRNETAEAIRYSPRIGEHSREVLQKELGISDSDYADLEARGITGAPES